MKSKFFSLIALLASIVGLFFFFCTTPTNPWGSFNTKIHLVARTSTQLAGNQGLVDSVGNPITAGFYCNFPANIDSVQLELVSTNGSDSLLKTFTNFSTVKDTDTLWQTIVFGDTGTKTIKGVAYIKNYQPYFDSVSVHIYGKPVNHRPVLLVSGQTTIAQKGVFVLTVTAIDTDLLQKVSVSMLYGPKGSRLTDTTFIWTPDSNFSGTDSAVFVAQDNGYPVMYDTVRTIITVTGVTTAIGPKWNSKTVNLVGQPGNSIKMTLSDKFTYAQKDNVNFTLLSAPPAGDSISVSALDTAYFFMPGPTDTGVFNPQIVVKNTAGLSDTLTITLTIHAPGAIDTLPPTMKLLSPLPDSSSVSSSALSVKILCKDPSGVASVKCFIGAAAMPVTAADSTYTAAVSRLKAGVLTTLAFIAADSSARANKDTLFVHIKYDSTMADNVPPLISLVSPSKDTVIGADSITVRVKCTDASGVASVVCSLKTNQTFVATKSTPSDSVYSATVKSLTAGAYSTVTVTATDASPAHNAAAATVRIKYDNDKTPPSVLLFSPGNTNDSAVVSGNAATVQVICKDASGVASVTYSMGSAAPQSMSKSTTADSIWSASITGLAAGQFSTLNIVAMDSSLAANKDTLIVHIKYDTTKADITGPTIAKVSGLATAARTANANDTLVYTVTDPSGVDTVSWTLNGTPSGVLIADANGHYSIKAVLTASHKNIIVLIAYDKSANHNKSTDTTIVDYNRPPVISGAHDTTVLELSAVQFTVTATDPDNDKVTLTAPTLPTGATFNATTGAFAWSPTVSQAGPNAVVFKANDGLDTSTKSISIVVSNMPAPVITVNPDTLTVKCSGSPASFSVTATGTGTLTYQWKNAAGNLTGTHYTGATTNSLSINAVATSDAGTYTCVVTDAAGNVSTSTGAKLAVNTPSSTPTLAVASSSSANICPPGSVTFTITGTLGSGANWNVYAGGTKLPTQPTITNNSFTISNIATATSYSIKAENGSCDNASSPPTSNSVAIAVSSSTVTFNSQGGSTVASQNITCGATATAPTAPTQTGYTFVGWCTDAAGTSAFSFTTPITAAITLYAKWTIIQYTVTFNSQGGSAVAPQNVNYNAMATTPTAPTQTGYTFVGWYTDAAGTTAFNFTTPITAAITLYAKWTINQYTVTFNSQGGSAVASQNVNYNATATQPTPPTKTGCTFAGWCTDAAGTSAFSFTTPITAAITLYAKWMIIQYTVTFNSQGGSAVTSQNVNYNATATQPTAPTLSCNTFVGWYTDAAGTSAFSFTTPITAAITLYAKWTLNNPTIIGQPSSQTICAGNSATFSIAISGATAPLSYKWYQMVSGSPSLVGTNSSSLSVVTDSLTGSATGSFTNQYYCVATDNCGKQVTSNTATLTVDYLPDVPTVEFETDIDATLWLHCAVLQTSPSTYYCCYYRYNKNNTGWTAWSNTDGLNTCDGMSSTLGGATPANTVQVQAYTLNKVTNCQSALTTINWPQ